MISNATGARQHASLIEAKEMASKRPTTIAEYIRAAPGEGAAAFAPAVRDPQAWRRRPRRRSSGEPASSWSPDSCSLSLDALSNWGVTRQTPRRLRRSWEADSRIWRQLPASRRPDNGGKPSRGELPISAAVRFFVAMHGVVVRTESMTQDIHRKLDPCSRGCLRKREMPV